MQMPKVSVGMVSNELLYATKIRKAALIGVPILLMVDNSELAHSKTYDLDN